MDDTEGSAAAIVGVGFSVDKKRVVDMDGFSVLVSVLENIANLVRASDRGQ